MYLSSLSLKQFRNYSDRSFSFENGPVIFAGQNSSGKTNILEAIELLSLGKSFRKVSDDELIQWGEKSFEIASSFIKQNESLTLDMRLVASEIGNKKAFLINGAKTSLVAFLGTVLTVIFSPQDVSLFLLPPSARRRFMDTTLCKTSAAYCAALIEYPKIIANRNKLLHAIREGSADADELLFWDEKLALLGAEIMHERKKFISFANEHLSSLYELLAMHPGQDRMVTLAYKTVTPLDATSTISHIHDALLDRIQKSRKQDILFATTQVGPHRDDFSVMMNDRDMSDVGSRGDQRIAIFALKLLQKDFLFEQTESRPLLLLDDVYSELDQKRCAALTQLVSDNQVFITTTDVHNVPEALRSSAQVFTIEQGVARDTSLTPSHA